MEEACMDEGLPEIDKNEAMQKQIATIAARLAAIEHKIDAIAKHLGVAGYEIETAPLYGHQREEVRRD
jgi:hypothetical protein